MRILHVTEAFGGGVLEMIATLSERLDRAGETVAVAYGRRPETPVDVESRFAPGIEMIPLGWEQRTAQAQLAAWRRLRRQVGEWQPDIVHLHSSFAGLAAAVALPRSVKQIYTPHGYSFTMQDQSRAHRLAFRLVERLTALRVTLIGAVSESEAYTAREIASPRKVAVVRNGVPELDDLDPAAPLPQRSGRPRVIALGRVTAQHLPEASARILAAVADLAEVEWVGGGGRGDVSTSVVTDRGVPLSGWLERDAALARLHGATALLHWTGWDGQPLSILEAMANDVVVIGHDIDAIREMVGEAQICSDEEEAIALLRRVLGDADLRTEMLRAQRRRRVDYSAESMAEGWLELYRRLTDESLPPLMHRPQAADMRHMSSLRSR